MSHEPKQKPGKSEQTVCTPPDFFAAVEAKFGPMLVDLAATAENTKCKMYLTPENNSLTWDWRVFWGNCWLNPPYAKIAPWVEKCCWYSSFKRKIHVWVPAAVGSNWWANHVHERCRVYFLSPRIKAVGHKDPYPKDQALLVYGMATGYETWRWKPCRSTKSKADTSGASTATPTRTEQAPSGSKLLSTQTGITETAVARLGSS